MKPIPLKKQSKREQRKFYAKRRGSWNGVSPVTRAAASKKIYARNRIRQADRHSEDD